LLKIERKNQITGDKKNYSQKIANEYFDDRPSLAKKQSQGSLPLKTIFFSNLIHAFRLTLFGLWGHHIPSSMDS
jgi:hypothetical protein